MCVLSIHVRADGLTWHGAGLSARAAGAGAECVLQSSQVHMINEGTLTLASCQTQLAL